MSPRAPHPATSSDADELENYWADIRRPRKNHAVVDERAPRVMWGPPWTWFSTLPSILGACQRQPAPDDVLRRLDPRHPERVARLVPPNGIELSGVRPEEFVFGTPAAVHFRSRSFGVVRRELERLGLHRVYRGHSHDVRCLEGGGVGLPVIAVFFMWDRPQDRQRFAEHFAVGVCSKAGQLPVAWLSLLPSSEGNVLVEHALRDIALVQVDIFVPMLNE